jgi:hypothetical protein
MIGDQEMVDEHQADRERPQCIKTANHLGIQNLAKLLVDGLEANLCPGGIAGCAASKTPKRARPLEHARKARSLDLQTGHGLSA